jgi:hypothetical protein
MTAIIDRDGGRPRPAPDAGGPLRLGELSLPLYGRHLVRRWSRIIDTPHLEHSDRQSDVSCHTLDLRRRCPITEHNNLTAFAASGILQR